MYADVIVDITHIGADKIFEYSFSDTDGAVKKGTRVLVPFGKKSIEGIVIGIKEKAVFPTDKIKPIIKVIEETPALTDETLALSEFICEKYFVTRASSLRLFLPSEMRKGKVKEKTFFLVRKNFTDSEEALRGLRKNAVGQTNLVKFLSDNDEIRLSEATQKFGSSAVKCLIEKKLIVLTQERDIRTPYKGLNKKSKEVVLTKAQAKAVNGVLSTDKTTTLLFGVTGSGKTEVYLNFIENQINLGKTAIFLVPEISLTPQMLSQLRNRFGETVAILHSGLSAGERFDEWWRLRDGTAKIAVGARSAIFSPVSDIGVIIIDEEHDGSYQSESSPRYDTLEVAKFRAEYNGAKIVLGSATPSVGSFMRAENGEYNLEKLTERINKRSLPSVEIVDMKKEVRRGNASPFSSALKSEIEETLEKHKQAILFLNQRGYSKNVICTECGHVQNCPSCDVSLTYHMEDNSLLCHYCGAKFKMITACTECGSKYLKYGGTGTEKVVAELKKLYPQARILRMDRDTTQNKEGHFGILKDFSEHKADILVGTQMVAKGHDFPDVTLVGILDADMSLNFSDYRSNERTFALITQVAGRSGRASEEGKVVLQTYAPENEVLLRAVRYDYLGFYKREIAIRKATAFPPFTDIVRVLVSSVKEEYAVETTRRIYDKISLIYSSHKDKFRFFGCMKSPIKRLQNKFRYQILMRLVVGEDEIFKRINEIIGECRDGKAGAYLEINPNNLT